MTKGLELDKLKPTIKVDVNIYKWINVTNALKEWQNVTSSKTTKSIWSQDENIQQTRNIRNISLNC